MAGDSFRALILNPLKFRLFLMRKLPAAWFAGLRITKFTDDACTVSVPFKWFTQNPFRSTYFACLAMAAELSTGALCMQVIYKRRPPVSMLVTGINARFFKKATSLVFFTCGDARAIRAAIEKAITSGEAQTITARSVGRNAAGETIAEFEFNWSFKAKS